MPSPDAPRAPGDQDLAAFPTGKDNPRTLKPLCFYSSQTRVPLGGCRGRGCKANPRPRLTQEGAKVTPINPPAPKPPCPRRGLSPGRQRRPTEPSPGSSPRSAGTRHAPAWHVFPGLPKQRRKHNKQQQHTADSRQTFPSYFLPGSVCAFPPSPTRKLLPSEGNNNIILKRVKPAPSQQEQSCQESAGFWGGTRKPPSLNPESQPGWPEPLTLPAGCRRPGLPVPSNRGCAQARLAE